MEVPMLDEDEYSLVTSKHGTKKGESKQEMRERFFGPVLVEYERVTGFRALFITIGFLSMAHLAQLARNR